MSVFGIVTARRVVAAQLAEAPAATHQRSEGASERVAMLDVDEINGIRIQRLHALGLAAAGDTEAPDERTIQEARAARTRGITLDGEQVATAGNLVVVTRGGIAGWLKRNRGKKADPETLAWLRGQEAADGSPAYAAWADRDDASILNWAREQRRADAAPPTAPRPPGAAEHSDGASLPMPPGAAEHSDGASLPMPPGAADGSGGASAPTAHHAVGTEPRTRVEAGQAVAERVDAPGAARGPAVQGLDLVGLGGAAAGALQAQATADPGAAELASLGDDLQRLISTGAATISIRDHHIVLALVCDQLFQSNQPELTHEGSRRMRELGRVLADDRGHAYKVTVDRERAFELVSNLAIAGLAPERIEIALKDVDRAIDLIELEWIAVRGTP